MVPPEDWDFKILITDDAILDVVRNPDPFIVWYVPKLHLLEADYVLERESRDKVIQDLIAYGGIERRNGWATGCPS